MKIGKNNYVSVWELIGENYQKSDIKQLLLTSRWISVFDRHSQLDPWHDGKFRRMEKCETMYRCGWKQQVHQILVVSNSNMVFVVCMWVWDLFLPCALIRISFWKLHGFSELVHPVHCCRNLGGLLPQFLLEKQLVLLIEKDHRRKQSNFLVD